MKCTGCKIELSLVDAVGGDQIFANAYEKFGFAGQEDEYKLLSKEVEETDKHCKLDFCLTCAEKLVARIEKDQARVRELAEEAENVVQRKW